jgi:hypothetical protein
MKDEPLTRRKGARPAQEPASKGAAKPRPEHAPTVIHDPTADETILARWLRESLEKGPRFWLSIGAAAVLLAALVIAVSSFGRGSSAASAAWTELMLARDVDEQVKIGQSTEGPVAAWALLQAAEERYREAFNDLPHNRDAALPLLSNAYDLFRQARDKAPADSPARRFAAMGMARCLEARGDLEGAIQHYQEVVQSFPGTDEARQAEELAALLKKPETIAFYQKFSSFRPAEVTIPPRGSTGINLPGLPPDHPPLDGPPIPAPGLDQPETGPAPLLAPPAGLPPLDSTPPPAEPKAEAPAEPKDAPAPQP